MELRTDGQKRASESGMKGGVTLFGDVACSLTAKL